MVHAGLLRPGTLFAAYDKFKTANIESSLVKTTKNLMKIETFLTLQSVLKTGSLAAAAKELHLTPSAVSMQMKQLEIYIGHQLFDRSGLSVKALQSAYELSDSMAEVLARLEAFRHQKTIVVEGHIRMGVIESLQPVVLPGLMRAMQVRYPALKLQSHRGKSFELTNAVKAGELDAAVVAQPEDGGSSRLHWHPLMQQELALIVPPREKERSFTALLKRYDWIRYDRGTVSGRMAARYVKQRMRQKQSTIELDVVRAIVAMVSVGLGFSIVQLSEPGICMVYPVNVLPLRDAPVLQFSLVTRKDETESRPLLALRELLMQTFASMPS
jgi:DNA-binding transcriptional LysR family regulator